MTSSLQIIDLNKTESETLIPMRLWKECFKSLESGLVEEVVARTDLDKKKLILSPVITETNKLIIRSNHGEELDKTIHAICEAIELSNLGSIKTGQMLKTLFSLQETAKKENLEFELSNCTVKASISPKKQLKNTDKLILKGETTIYGVVETVGGSNRTKPTAHIRNLADSEQITCILPNEQAALKLAAKLYKEVALSGQAEWLIKDWTVKNFIVEEVLDYEEPQSLIVSIDSIGNLAQQGWIGGSPSEFIEEMRR